MWWIYISLLQGFKDTNFKISAMTAKFFKILLFTATIGYVIFAMFIAIYHCECKLIPFWDIIVPVAWLTDFILSFTLLLFYVAKLIKLLFHIQTYTVMQTRKKRSSSTTTTTTSTKTTKTTTTTASSHSRNKKQKQINLIIFVAAKHTFIVILSIVSTWVLVFLPTIIYVSLSLFFLFCTDVITMPPSNCR